MSAWCLKRFPGLPNDTFPYCSDSRLSKHQASMIYLLIASQRALPPGNELLPTADQKQEVAIMWKVPPEQNWSWQATLSSPPCLPNIAVFTRNATLHLCISVVSKPKTADRIAACLASRHHLDCDDPWCCCHCSFPSLYHLCASKSSFRLTGL